MLKVMRKFLVASLFLAACASSKPEIFLGDAKCPIPCWYGLTPGETTMPETQSILGSLPFVLNGSIGKITNDLGTGVSWRFTGQVTGHGAASFDKNGLLRGINIRTIGLPLGEVIDAFGSPEKIWAAYFPGNGIDYVVTLYYPTKGIAVRTSDKASGNPDTGTERLTRDLNIYEIEFFAPTNLEAFLSGIEGRSQDNINYILDRLQSWPGFGNNVVHIRP